MVEVNLRPQDGSVERLRCDGTLNLVDGEQYL